jgi:Queuine tRNA-ribosyltransferase
MPHPRVLVVTSCTGEKCAKPENQLTLTDFKNPEQLQQREAELAEFVCAAGKMYTGMQHLRLMEGVQLLRQSLGQDAVDVAILSAGYGLIEENRAIAPYEVTFNGMKGHEVDSWAQHLNVHESLKQAVQGYDLIFLLLGDNYLRAIKLPVETKPNQTVIALTSQGSAKLVKGLSAKTFVLPLTNQDAQKYSYGLVGLKGFLFKRFAETASKDLDWLPKVYQTPDLFTETLVQAIAQLELSLPEVVAHPKPAKASKAKSAKTLEVEDEDVEDSEFLPIPEVPAAANLHLGMQYFIPEWDDHVDPGYDFLNNRLTPGRDPYADEVYAHQIYPTPNYDGILVSKVVVDSSKKKRARVEAVGIHNFIRFPGKVMGDCGAFGYIKEDVPPYNTTEILDYYQNLGFDFGVSIDHLIVGPFAQPGIRERRYELTKRNAQDFLEKHQMGGYTFTPIGVAQGWSPEIYAEAVKDNISMGYDYIALGGLARATSQEIISILTKIRPHLTDKTRLHLFGVARINAIPVFRHLGVTSFDSASPLRRAWLGSGANYHTLTSKMYTAARIPPVDSHGVRIKRLLEAGVSDQDTLREMEQAALKALREFDAGTLGLEETLEALLTYDELLELPRDGKVDPTDQAKRRVKHERMYRYLLQDKPWKNCNCVICKEIGVEVIIFRGNDRNRRRGFHNTYVFYKRFQELLQHLCNHSKPR